MTGVQTCALPICKVQIEDASTLPSETYLITDYLARKYGGESGQNISVVSSGPGAEHTRFGCLNLSWYDPTRKIHRFKQAGRGGIGTVLRNKRIKAIAVKYSGRITVDTNGPADPETVKQLGNEHSQENQETRSETERDVHHWHYSPHNYHERFRLIACPQFQIRKSS